MYINEESGEEEIDDSCESQYLVKRQQPLVIKAVEAEFTPRNDNSKELLMLAAKANKKLKKSARVKAVLNTQR